ncbi:hypothetical protein C0991_006468 [Blastosporella zonata]|nr:hypothetical protein C0991_006468 [Blastosporella zonata]
MENEHLQLSTPGQPSTGLPSVLSLKAPPSPRRSPTHSTSFSPPDTQAPSDFPMLGIKVTTSTTYSASFFYRFPTSSSFRGTATLSLKATTGTVLGSSAVSISGAQTSWAQLTVQITPTVAPASGSTANVFVLSLDGAAAAGQTINFAMFSLFPPTFKNRPNGMRADIASVRVNLFPLIALDPNGFCMKALVEMGPSFFRFPGKLDFMKAGKDESNGWVLTLGGNNLEGQTVAQRWQWNATVGPLVNRPGRVGDWGYVNTDGLGLLDYLNWCEDSGMQPIMAIWAGFALGGTSVAEASLAPYIQQAADQVRLTDYGVLYPQTPSADQLRDWC